MCWVFFQRYRRSDKGNLFKDVLLSSLKKKKKSLVLGPLTVETALPAVKTLFIIHSSSVKVHVEHQMRQNGYLVLAESNASIFPPEP